MFFKKSTQVHLLRFLVSYCVGHEGFYEDCCRMYFVMEVHSKYIGWWKCGFKLANGVLVEVL